MNRMAIPMVDRGYTLKDYIPGQPIPALVRDPASGRIVVNPLKAYVKPYTLTTEPEVMSLTAGQVSAPIPMVLDNKGHFEIFDAYFRSSQPEGFTVMLFDPAERPFLMNREIHVATFASGLATVSTNYETFGTGGLAGRWFRWPETFFMNVEEGGKAIFAVFRNLSASTNVIRFMFKGLRWYHVQAPTKIANRMQQIYRTRPRTFPFFYTTEKIVQLDGGASGDFDMRFTDEAWTEWVKTMAFATSDDYNVRIRETATRKLLMEQALPSSHVFGIGEFPFLNWESNLFEPNYKLTFELEDTSGSDNTIWITTACRKILWDEREKQFSRPHEAAGAEV